MTNQLLVTIPLQRSQLARLLAGGTTGLHRPNVQSERQEPRQLLVVGQYRETRRPAVT